MTTVLKALILAIAASFSLVVAAEKATPQVHQQRAPKIAPAPAQNDVPPMGISTISDLPPNPNAPPQKVSAYAPKPLPATRRIVSELKSVDEAYPHMWVSFPYQSQNASYVTTGADLIKVNIDILESGVKEALKAGEKADRIAVDYNRYEIGDPRVVDFHLRLVNQYKIGEDVIYTDGNVFADHTFSAGEKNYFSAFSSPKMKIKDTPEGKAIQKLVAAGYVLCGSDKQYKELAAKNNGQKKYIIAQGIYDKNRVKEIPIEHIKSGSVIVKNADDTYKRGIVAIKSTCNDTDPPNAEYDASGAITTFSRYNRLLEVREQNLIRYMREASLALRDSLGNGLEIKDTVSATPPEIYFPGSQEIIKAYHTDGKFNPNDEQNRLMQLAIQQPDKVSISKILSNQFVDTYKDGLQSERQLKAKFPDIEHDGMYDMHFSDVYGFGFAPARAGFAIFRPMGGPIYPFGFMARKNYNIYIYIRGITGVSVEDEEGAPTNVALDHDKTNVYTVKILGVDFKVIFFGSLNYSGHFANAEYQDQVYAKPDSQFAQSFEESITSFINVELKAGHAWPAKEGVVAITLARFTDHTEFEVDRASVDQLIQTLENKDLNEQSLQAAGPIIMAIAQKPTTLKQRPDLQVIQTRLTKMYQFIKWYLGKFPQANGISAEKWVDIVVPLIHEKMPALQKKFAVQLMTFDSKLTPDQRSAVTKAVWDELHSLQFLTEDMPADPDPTKQQAAPEKTENPHRQSPPATGSVVTPTQTPAPAAAAPAPAPAATGEQQTTVLNRFLHVLRRLRTTATPATAPAQPPTVVPAAPVTSTAPAATATVPLPHFYIIDFDDNFMTTDARIYLRSKTNHRNVVSVSTAKWATVRTQLATSPYWKGYEEFTGTMKDFAPGQLLKSLPIKNGKLTVTKSMKSPSYVAIQQACLTKEGASHVYINTARTGADDLNKLFDILVASGELAYRPPKENILIGGDTPQKKQDNVMRVLTIANATPIPANAQLILTPDAHTHAPLITVGMSDDDLSNIRAIASMMTEVERHQTFPNLKMTVFYTGNQIYPNEAIKHVKRGAYVITSSGLRPQLPEELAEYSSVMHSTVGRIIVPPKCEDYLGFQH